MNAYELADKLQMDKASALLYADAVVQSADMLRQQADRIAELEKQSEPVAWINIDSEQGKSVSFEKNQWAEITIPLYTTPQTNSYKFGVDWSKDGNAVTVLKIHADGTSEVVFVDYQEKITPQTKPLSDGFSLNPIPHPHNNVDVPERLNTDALETVEIDLPFNKFDEVLDKAFNYYCETDEGVLRFDLELREEWKQDQLQRWKEAFRKAWD